MSSGLQIGLSGILAARTAIDTVGSNIANARTEGYARRTVQFTGQSWTYSDADGSGASVRVQSIQREKDLFLEARVQSQMGALARYDVQSKYFTEIEGLLQEPSDDGIAAAIEQFFNQWETVATQPDSATARTTLLLNASHLADKIAALRRGLTDLQQAASIDVNNMVDEINAKAVALAEVNQRLMLYTPDPSAAPPSLCDERDLLVRQLADLVGASNATPNLLTARISIGNTLLVDGPTALRLYAPTDLGNPVTTGPNGTGSPVAAAAGELAGLMTLIQDTLPEYISQLDTFAAALIEQVNTIHLQGINQHGRFTSLDSAWSPRDLDGDGNPYNDPLSAAGLPFAPTAGSISINVYEEATATATVRTIAVDPAAMGLSDLAAALDTVPGLSAAILNGRLRIAADTGYRFDFTPDQGSNLLAALGVNAFFTGTDAATLQVNPWLDGRPERIAAGLGAEAGDGQVAERIAALRNSATVGAKALTPADFWRGFVTQIGNEAANVRSTTATQRNLVDILKSQEDSISGVNTDEEAARLLEYQQMYQSCAKYLSVISRLTETLLEIM